MVAVSRAAVAPTKVMAAERRKWLLLAARAFENAGEPSYAAGVSSPPLPPAHLRLLPARCMCSGAHHTTLQASWALLQGQARTPLLPRLTRRIAAALPYALHVAVACLRTFERTRTAVD